MRFCARILILLLAASPLLAQTQAGQSQQAPAPPKLQHFEPSQVDKSVDPCTDFYQYTCGKFFKENPIPPDQVTWGTASPLRLWNETILRETLETAAAKKQGRTANEQKIGDYWTACMDESGIDKSAPAEIKTELSRIDAIKNKSQIVDELARMHSLVPGSWVPDDNETPTAILGFTAAQDYNDATKVIPQFDQGGMMLPGRDFYLKDDPHSTDIRTKYLAHVASMLKLAGESDAKANADAKTIMAIETEMAKNAMDNIKRRDPKNVNNKMPLAQVQALTPSFDFKRYLTLVKAPDSQQYLVTSPDFFRGLEQMLKTHSVEDWKTYFRWSLVHMSAPTLSEPFVQENWNFYAKTLGGAKQMTPRWRRCVRAADRDLGEALGQSYVERAFAGDRKQETTDMVKAVEKALDKDITQLSWMTPATKQKAKEKLQLILDKVGYPDKWRDYSSVTITPSSYFKNVASASSYELNRWVQKIGKPVDRYEWGMTPPTINAYYDPQMNTINFPAGILQPPFFDAKQDVAINYGAAGSVMGHEITHGFDDQGRKFDGNGNLRDWWTEADAKAYEERGKCISDEYTAEIPEYGVKTNGLLTQGEDTADNGGIYLALIAMENTLQSQGKKVDEKADDGLTPIQHFFFGYANNWCSQYRPEIARVVIGTNPHSLPKFRVNNVLSNMPEFATAFGCKKGQPMVHENACRVW
jgi:putative endopeptidase